MYLDTTNVKGVVAGWSSDAIENKVFLRISYHNKYDQVIVI